MAPRAASAVCVQPSKKKCENKKSENKKNENLQGRLPRRNPSRAMTPHAMPGAFVNPWQGRKHGGARWSRRALPPGDCVSITAPETTRGSKTAGAASDSFFQRSTRGLAGKTWLLACPSSRTYCSFRATPLASRTKMPVFSILERTHLSDKKFAPTSWVRACTF